MSQLPRDRITGHVPLGPDLAATVAPASVIFEAAHPITAGAILDRIHHFASGLAQAGARGGMKIGLHLPAGGERLAVMLAVTALGAIAVPIDPAMGQARLIIARQGAELDMVVEGDTALPATARTGLKILKINDITPEVIRPPLPHPQPGTPAVALFGQGARDCGRAVMLSHRALHSAAIGLIKRFGLTTGLRVHVPLSFNHAPRLVAEIACLISGARLTDTAQGTDLAILADEMPQFGPEDAPKTILLHAAPRDMRALIRRFPQSRVFNAYARAEMCGLALTSDPRDPAHTTITTVGRPLPGVEVMIVDPRTGFDMLLYEVGEIWLRGPMVMSGYDHAPRASAQALDRAGFFHTGDMGYLDSEGRVILSINHAQI